LLEHAVAALQESGATVDREARPAVAFDEGVATFWKLLTPVISAGMPAEVIDVFRSIAGADPADDDNPLTSYARAATQSHHEWIDTNEHREQLCRRWAEFFEHHDVLLCPVTPVPAIPHSQEGEVLTRTIEVNGSEAPYLELLSWMGFIGVVRLPSTVVPLGLTEQGLPVGVQVVGPYLEDRTTMDFAGRLSQIVGDVGRPPRFA
jgi:amidase